MQIKESWEIADQEVWSDIVLALNSWLYYSLVKVVKQSLAVSDIISIVDVLECSQQSESILVIEFVKLLIQLVRYLVKDWVSEYVEGASVSEVSEQSDELICGQKLEVSLFSDDLIKFVDQQIQLLNTILWSVKSVHYLYHWSDVLNYLRLVQILCDLLGDWEHEWKMHEISENLSLDIEAKSRDLLFVLWIREQGLSSLSHTILKFEWNEVL